MEKKMVLIPRTLKLITKIYEKNSIKYTKQSLTKKVISIVNYLLSYVLITFTTIISLIYFFILNRTKIKGISNLNPKKNTLYLSNHSTMIDSFLVGSIISLPTMFFKPKLFPCHPAAKENFFKTKTLAWFSSMWKCIPVRRGQKDFKALNIMNHSLKNGVMLIYPEGSRSRNGEIMNGRPGTGKLIHDTKATCIPVYVKGMDKILPIGKSFPRFFKRIEVTIGKPVEFGNLMNETSSKTTSKKIISKVMNDIRELKQINLLN
jgi:1-acyl-sn-glycerol-3-phosphate acyltransferase